MVVTTSDVTFYPISVKRAVVKIGRDYGCGGWCVQVVVKRNGRPDCYSKTVPPNCQTSGFSGGTILHADFDEACTLDGGEESSPYDEPLQIGFQLHTPVGGSYSDWCTNFVKFKADNGVKSVYYDTPADAYGSLWWVNQGSYAKVYYSLRIHGRDPYWMHFD